MSRQKSLLILTFIIGVLLRLIFPGDIEFKMDEQWMYERAKNVGISESLPMVGMPSGVGTRNPGMSVWVFVGLAKVFGTDTPPDLARGVQWINILALALIGLFAYRLPPGRERELWLWAFVFAAVNPMSVLFDRKLWAQCVLPLFCMISLLGWWTRDRRMGALTWGFFAAILGQIHMSGFFFSFALFAWTAIWGRRLGVQAKSARWGYWFVGSVLGALLMIPWLQYLHQDSGHSQIRLNPLHILNNFKVIWLFWIKGDPIGYGLGYSIGHRRLAEMTSYPLIGGMPTYLVALAQWGTVALWYTTLALAIRKWWPQRKSWLGRWMGSASPTAFLLGSTIFGFAAVLAASGAVIHRHYLIIAYPLEWVAAASLVFAAFNRPQRVLALFAICQLVLSIAFLSYIHLHGGAPGDDYGIGYQYQEQNRVQ